MIKSLFIEKDSKQFETKHKLWRNGNNGKEIKIISFCVNKDNFPTIKPSSTKKALKLLNSNTTKSLKKLEVS